MENRSEKLFDALLSAEQSANTVRTAFKNFADSVVKAQQTFDEKKEKREKDMEHGARRTSHKFRI